MRNLLAVLALVLAFALGALAVWHFAHREPPLPDAPSLIMKVREVARLETLDVTLYKKLDFAPDPHYSDSVWDMAVQYLRKPRGKAIVFAIAHLSLDLRKLDESSLRVEGRRVEVVLPRVQTRVELLPAQTEIIGSNLESQQTAGLFEAAKTGFERDVSADAALQQRARESAQQTLRSLFRGMGFMEVSFVEQLSAGQKRG